MQKDAPPVTELTNLFSHILETNSHFYLTFNVWHVDDDYYKDKDYFENILNKHHIHAQSASDTINMLINMFDVDIKDMSHFYHNPEPICTIDDNDIYSLADLVIKVM